MPVRSALSSDASSIAALSIEVWIGTYIKRGVSAFFADYALQTFTPDKTLALIANPEQMILVSENVEGIDGVLRLSRNSPAPVEGCGDLEIATLYVQPRHHGKGIGRALLRAAFERLGDAETVWLATNSENTPAIGFYLAQGFQQVGETQFRIKEQAYRNNVYAYRLS
ncbi:GNAT family N-acetyltransferase [Citreicella sp. C3M06]|uniref:GNAT family N-acetyltransferase n=1 Tax=Citreicella sp. C3M06 TaxID=2841564 RepID=UPI001C09B773|nr:N-acetyltransferase [Citreicella sp. C3M06]MBU2961733.1 GNAT family N-acetyltransferase [Citreicella sp. C3M06]